MVQTDTVVTFVLCQFSEVRHATDCCLQQMERYWGNINASKGDIAHSSLSYMYTWYSTFCLLELGVAPSLHCIHKREWNLC